MALLGTGLSTGGWLAPLNLSTTANLPISISGWFRLPAGAPNTCFFALTGDEVNSEASMAAVYYGGALYNDAYDDTGTTEGGEYVSWTATYNWHHLCIQWVNVNTWTLYLDGVNYGNANFGSTLGAATFSQLRIGYATTAASEPAFATGSAVAEVSVWAGTLLDHEIVALAGGANPLALDGGRLRAYYPLRNSFAGHAQGNRRGLAPSGAVADPIWTDHPSVARLPLARTALAMNPRTATLVVQQAAAAVSASGSLSVTGALAVTQNDQNRPIVATLGSPFSADFSADFGGASFQASQTVAATGGVVATATLNQAGRNQFISASGTVGGGNYLVATQAGQTVTASGRVGVAGSLARTQSGQSINAGANVFNSPTANPFSSDFSSDFGVVVRDAALGDPFTSTFTTNFGTGTPSVQDDQTLAAQAFVGVGSALGNPFASAFSADFGSGSPLQVSQTVAATGRVAISASATIAQSAQTFAGSSVTGTVGVLGARQANQTIAARAAVAVGAVAGNPFSADFSTAFGATVQAAQTIAATGRTIVVGLLGDPFTAEFTGDYGSGSGLQAPDTIAAAAIVAITAAVGNPYAADFAPDFGSGSSLQTGQTVSAAGSSPIVSALSAIQPAETITGTASVPAAATLSAAQDTNGIVATAGPIIGAAIIQSQPAQTIAATAAAPVIGQTNATQDTQAFSGAASIDVGGAVGNPFAGSFASDFGTGATLQAPQTVTAAAVLTVAAVLFDVQPDQTIVANGPIVVAGTLAATQSDNAIAASGALSTIAQLASAQPDQTLAATGNITLPVVATLSATQGDDTIAATLMPYIIGALGIPQAGNAISASGIAPSLDPRVITLPPCLRVVRIPELIGF